MLWVPRKSCQFVDKVNRFLNFFGLNRDRADLIQQAEQIGGFLALWNKGQHLYIQGQYQDAAQVCKEILTSLEKQPSYELCITLGLLGQCFAKQGKAEQAIAHYRQELTLLEKLETSNSVKREKWIVFIDLADVLMNKGELEKARKVYDAALVIAKKQNDARNIAALEGQLGNLFMYQGNLQEAAERYREALVIFQRLNEPEMEAVLYNQLGIVYQKAQQWDVAEVAYRESARINESQGSIAYVAGTWNNLALLN